MVPAPCSPTSCEPGGCWAVGTSLPPQGPIPWRVVLSPQWGAGVHTTPRATCMRGRVPYVCPAVRMGWLPQPRVSQHLCSPVPPAQGHGPSSCLARLTVSGGELGSGATITTNTTNT